MEYIIDTRAEAVIDNGEKERLALHRQWAEQQDMKGRTALDAPLSPALTSIRRV
jgi:hypothetical protein